MPLYESCSGPGCVPRRENVEPLLVTVFPMPPPATVVPLNVKVDRVVPSGLITKEPVTLPSVIDTGFAELGLFRLIDVERDVLVNVPSPLLTVYPRIDCVLRPNPGNTPGELASGLKFASNPVGLLTHVFVCV